MLNAIHQGVSAYLEKSLEAPKGRFQLFSRPKTLIQFGSGDQAQSGEYSLRASQITFERQNSSATFHEEVDGRVFVFRFPEQVCIHYQLLSGELGLEGASNALDQLAQGHFDRPFLGPFFPKDFENFPELISKMKNNRSELTLDSLNLTSSGKKIEVKMIYQGPYHSGNPIREEKRVTSRKIQTRTTVTKTTERRL